MLPTAGLEGLFNGNTNVTIAVPIAIITAIVIWFILSKTKFGYELKATGNNKNAAKYAGMAQNRNIILTLMISGALAGLGASLLYQTGYMRWECTQSSVPSMGFNGIAAAFLGGLHPIGAIFSSFFIQHITDGGQYVNTNFYSSQISDVISSVIIYLCGFVLFIKLTMNKLITKSEEKKGAKQ
jgi:simple sugar transport system permease protein